MANKRTTKRGDCTTEDTEGAETGFVHEFAQIFGALRVFGWEGAGGLRGGFEGAGLLVGEV